MPRKQRWIGHTIFLALKEQGYQGAESTVRRYIGQVRKRQARSEAYVPLEYEPGEVAAQLLCLRLRWSRMPFVLAYPAQKQEAMFDGISRGFAALGGVPRQLKSDNLKQAVQKILEGGERKEQDAFIAFRTHHLLESNFCNPGAGHEKGSVESLVGFAQRNLVGPHLEAGSWEEIQALLWQRCLQYAERTLPGERRSVREQWEFEKQFLRPLPDRPFDCCRVVPVTANKASLVQHDPAGTRFPHGMPARS